MNSYIKRDKIDIARVIAQQNYLNAIEKKLIKKRDAITAFLSTEYDREIEDCYDRLDEGRRALIIPLSGTAQARVDTWRSEKYEPNHSHPERLTHETDRGELVRSKSEELIANYLYSQRAFLDYKYERPLTLTVNGKKEVIYPDFTIMQLTGTIPALISSI